MTNRFISVTEAARRLNRGTATIRRWYHAGTLSGRRLGGQIEIEESIVEHVEAGGDLPPPEVDGERSEREAEG